MSERWASAGQLLATCCLSAAAVWAVGCAPKLLPLQEGWVEQTHLDAGIRIGLPPGWHPRPDANTDVLLAMGIGGGSSTEGPRCTVERTFVPRWESYGEDMGRRQKELASKILHRGFEAEVELKEEGFGPISGQPGHHMIIERQHDDRARTGELHAHVPRDSSLLSLICTAPADQFESLRPTFESVVKSWRVAGESDNRR